MLDGQEIGQPPYVERLLVVDLHQLMGLAKNQTEIQVALISHTVLTTPSHISFDNGDCIHLLCCKHDR
jgi:hypothetical protein